MNEVKIKIKIFKIVCALANVFCLSRAVNDLNNEERKTREKNKWKLNDYELKQMITLLETCEEFSSANCCLEIFKFWLLNFLKK